MSPGSEPRPAARRPRADFEFIPRIIHPVRIAEVHVFAADATIRAAGPALKEALPWIHVNVLTSPPAASDLQSEGACVVLLDDVALGLVDVERIRRRNAECVIVLLTGQQLIQCSPPAVARKVFPRVGDADLVFAVSPREFAADRIIAAVVRAAEDHLNIERHARARRFIFLIVDDEPRWFSQFLPVLYDIIGQRAAVKITRTFEETLTFLFGADTPAGVAPDHRAQGCGDDVVCLITDIFFPRGEEIQADAGRELIRLTKAHYPRIPVIIASKAQEASALADEGFVLPKGDPGSLETLRAYIRDLTGIGDFVIHDDAGAELYRLRDVRELYGLLQTADGEGPDAERLRGVLEWYGDRDMFSTWLYMHSLRDLAGRLRHLRLKGRRMVRVLRRQILREMLRMNFTPLVIDGHRAYDLRSLSALLRAVPFATLRSFADNDVISSWLDRKGFSELADELRPIHGTGADLGLRIAAIVDRWDDMYRARAVRAGEAS